MEKILLDAGPSERGWHQFESAARCLRLWAWRHKGDMPFKMSEPLVKGSLLHIGLAHYYQLKKTPDANYYTPFEAVGALAKREADATHDMHEKVLWANFVPLICAAIEEYARHYMNCGWKVLEVERELRAHIPKRPGSNETFLFTQRADLIVEDAHGFKWIVDHKSCYRITSKTLRQYILSGQFLGYQVSGRKLYGKKFGGVILNRVKLSEPYGFDRVAIDPAPAAVAGFVKMLQMTENRIQQWNHLDDPMDYPPVFSDQICYGKYGPCQAFQLCRWGEE